MAQLLSGKRILLGITGSIAAVKAPIIARELMRRGAKVVAALTPSAEKFTTALALSALTHEEVITEAFPKSLDGKSNSGTWHITLARSASVMLIAPCSATTLGKLASGIYDNAVTLLASALPQTTPLILAPAMDEEMWKQPIVQENLAKLRAHGVLIIEPASGLLASGLTGEGRMLEPNELVDKLEALLQYEQSLFGKRVLVTGGPTYEPIDPVRFLGNRSSGKMAVALANAATTRGAAVTLILGPSAVQTSSAITRIDINTAEEMLAAVMQELFTSDIIIMNAAVSDFAALHPSDSKLKKRELGEKGAGLSLDLKPTPDILRSIGELKTEQQFVVGFALETGDKAEDYAKGKLNEKGLDMVVLNRADVAGAGFSVDTNKVIIFTRDGIREELPLLTKEECAEEIVKRIATLVAAP
jgi:phosphopantothenoylcysteine decarboxylase/phosphopantothenate--cysteine ligase